MKSIKDVWALSETKSAAEIEEILQDNGCWLDVRFSLKSKDFEKYICEDMRFPGSDTFALVDVAIRDAKPGILKILGATDFNGFGQIVCFELHENGEIQIGRIQAERSWALPPRSYTNFQSGFVDGQNRSRRRVVQILNQIEGG